MSDAAITLPATSDIATYWGVTIRTAQRWIRNGLPVRHPVLMAKHIITQRRCAPKARTRAQAILAAELSPSPKPADPADPADLSTDPAPDPPVEDPEYLAWASGKTGKSPNLEELRNYYAYKLGPATRTGSQIDIKFWTDLLIKIDESLRRDKLLAEKLGIDQGQILPRNVVERYLHTLAFWLMRGVDQLLRELPPKLLNITYAEEAYHLLEPPLLDARFLAPLARAAANPSGISLPTWFITTLTDAVDDYIEHGAKNFTDQLNALADQIPTAAEAT
ncbi:MAG: hypothetical protein IID15_08155 [Candidatus Marinimicrobia bacterium]|nr:hypothetical protein [Candidatus Neomarinimicrobiota bacterium]